MTNDKTVTVSRELADRLNNLLRWHFGNEPECVELRRILAAPVVERQPEPAEFELIWEGIAANLPSHQRQSYSAAYVEYAEKQAAYEAWKASPPAPVAAPFDEREEFERNYLAEALERDGDEYVRMPVQMDWEGWQARACLDKVKEMNYRGHASDCSTNNRGVPELLGPCDCALSKKTP